MAHCMKRVEVKTNTSEISQNTWIIQLICMQSYKVLRIHNRVINMITHTDDISVKRLPPLSFILVILCLGYPCLASTCILRTVAVDFWSIVYFGV